MKTDKIPESLINQVKEKSISEYLRNKGIPEDSKRSTKKHTFFYSPFTKEQTASLVVNENKNSFFDNSYQMGGDIIKICMELERCDFRKAVEILAEITLAATKPKDETHNDLIIDKVSELRNLHLEDYLHYERKINVKLCYQYLTEVHFHFSNNPKAKQYAIGFKNDKDGYDLRSKYSKIATEPKYITTINPGKSTVLVFEGFMDFLSAVTFFNKIPEHTVIILNGTTMLMFADFTPYTVIKFFGDADAAGSKTLAKMPKGTVDCRSFFKGYKDFNEFLVKKI